MRLGGTLLSLLDRRRLHQVHHLNTRKGRVDSPPQNCGHQRVLCCSLQSHSTKVHSRITRSYRPDQKHSTRIRFLMLLDEPFELKTPTKRSCLFNSCVDRENVSLLKRERQVLSRICILSGI